MAISDASGVRHVRCPKCNSVLQEPSTVLVYKCGGCGTILRAKIRTGNTQETASVPNSDSVLPSQSKHLGSGDAASTSASTPDAPSTRHRGTDTTSRREAGDLVSARKRASEQVPPIAEKKGHDQSTGDSGHRREKHAGNAEFSAAAPVVSVKFSRGSKDAAQLQDSERRREAEPEPDAASKKDSGEAARPRSRDLSEIAPISARTTGSQSAQAVLKRGDDAEGKAKAPSPPRHAMSPLHEKILKTVDELKDELSELFSRSPEAKPRTPARPPRLPRQQGYASRPAAMASSLPTSRARHGHVGKHGQVAPRGLPSRRYRRCRADPCCHGVRPGSCHHGCCSHGKPECSSCRAHCCRPRGQEPPLRRPPAAKEARRRSAPRHHCRPVLKGAPFIVCSSCFKLVQVPADFAVSSNKVRKLRCGSCSAILSYSYRDPGRKTKPQQSIDQYSTDGSELHDGGGFARPDPFAFIDGFGNDVSYSTVEEQPLHVSRNSSFSTVAGEPNGGVAMQSPRLHRLMGYGSASDLLFRRSPDLYESFDKRTPDVARQHDRKGKGVCVDVDDDSDEEDSGALRRSNVRGVGWRPPGTLGKGIPGPGAIRIKS